MWEVLFNFGRRNKPNDEGNSNKECKGAGRPMNTSIKKGQDKIQGGPWRRKLETCNPQGEQAIHICLEKINSQRMTTFVLPGQPEWKQEQFKGLNFLMFKQTVINELTFQSMLSFSIWQVIFNPWAGWLLDLKTLVTSHFFAPDAPDSPAV